ncbi:Prefoldin [Atractiella rhizophila]|nr:Prefoldin [Atractiella rhizophila]
MSLESRMQAARQEYEDAENSLQKLVTSIQKLNTQQQENLSVKKEFDLLTPNNTVYKLIGQVLVRQEQQDAKENVNKRLEFITEQIKQVESSISAQQEKAEQKKLELVQLQTQLQQAQPGPK